jgi:ribonucleoside-diphosphate reductase alpha chain
MVTTRAALRAAAAVDGRVGLTLDRYFTTQGVHPYDDLEWEHRDAVITDHQTGEVSFEQRDVEFPTSWSMNATTIVAQKYFRGHLGTPGREHSVRHMIDRVADTITQWGTEGGYFADAESAQAFNHELKHLLVTQKAAFNSPVWFNVGVEDTPQASACFILSVEDQMASILNWYYEEGIIFKGGSGSGVNLSRIRSSEEKLKGGGEASGPVSFMRGADASAGTIKCLHADTDVVTDGGVCRIADIRPGQRVLTRHGFQAVTAAHDNGVRDVVRVRTELGDDVVCTPEHRFWVRGRDGEGWREAGELGDDDAILLDLSATAHGKPQSLQPVGTQHHNETSHDLPSTLDEGLALWLGLVAGAGSITDHAHTHQVALPVADEDSDLADRYEQLVATVFGDRLPVFRDRCHGHADTAQSVWFRSSHILGFLRANDLWKATPEAVGVPKAVWSSPQPVRAAFLAGLFEARGHVADGDPTLSTANAALAQEVHRLLLSVGVASLVEVGDDGAAAFGDAGGWRVRVVGPGGVGSFAKTVGFVSERKSRALEAALQVAPTGHDEASWTFSGNGAPTMSTSLPRFAEGDHLYVAATVEAAGQAPVVDLTVEGVHEYLVHGLVTHNSGGKTRRAAKMVILDSDHPDIEEFIWCKRDEEQKVRALEAAGYDMSFDSQALSTIQYQNANNSVRVDDDFMRAVDNDEEYQLIGRTDGEVKQTVRARDLFRQISQAAWECADPGLQYDTTINSWHTTPNAGRINGSNPCCFTGETLVETEAGPTRFDVLHKMAEAGQPLPAVKTFDAATGHVGVRRPDHVWIAGHTCDLLEVRSEAGLALTCTPEHRFRTHAGEYVEAQDLAVGTRLCVGTVGAETVVDRVTQVASVSPQEPETVYDLQMPETRNFVVSSDAASHGVVVHNSEYMHLDNSACNLASLNLRTFESDGVFDTEAFTRAVEIMFTAQEIIVGNSSYPTDAIAENAKAYRQLGLGYANLGGLLMSQGIAYDSDEGRAWAAAITALMTGHAYRTSAELARAQGPFDGYAQDREATLGVLRQHRDALADIDQDKVPTNILDAARRSWEEAVELGSEHGVRNAQASVLAPTGCLVGGSLVPTERGMVRLASLGDPAGSQWQDLDVGVATDEGARRASHFYVNGTEAVVTVDTAHGHRVQGTPAHRIKVVAADGRWAWKRFGDLEAGDSVPLAMNALVGEPQTVSLPPWGDHDGDEARHAVAPHTMTAQLAELVGYFMGGGSLTAEAVRLYVADGEFEVVEHLTRLGKELFNLEARISEQTASTEVALCSIGLAQWWQAAGFAQHAPSETHPGDRRDPHIPDAVLRANDRFVYAAFLRGLFEAEGTVTVGYPEWTTASPEFSHHVQSLLLALGYPTTRRVQPSGQGSQLVALRLLNTGYHQAWLDEIGFLSHRKIAAVSVTDHAQSAHDDRVPVTRQLIDRVAAANEGVGQAMLWEHRRHGRVSRRIASRAYDVSGDAELGRLLGFFYDEVHAAALGEDELTYDLSVPANTTYVANGFVSHNTIGLMMDCDTTGVEPDLGLVKMKKLVGGGTMRIINQTVPVALEKLGYQPEQIEAIVDYIDKHSTIEGAPGFRDEHLPVFDCAIGERSIAPMGHVLMMSAVQPFISGSLSKTVNLPESATVEDVEKMYFEGWKLGLKAIAIYRDNCKVAQPLAVADAKSSDAETESEPAATTHQAEQQGMVRRRLPKQRPSQTLSFAVGDAEGYLTAGEYPGDGLGEIFVKLGKQGSTLSGVMDAFAIAVSLGLQYGVPLEAYVKKFVNTRFEPSGITDDREVKFASSLIDYIFRRLAIEYLPSKTRQDIGIYTIAERNAQLEDGHGAFGGEQTREEPIADAEGQTVLPVDKPTPVNDVYGDAPMCVTCGVQMVRAGSCHLCQSCGATSGCS